MASLLLNAARRRRKTYLQRFSRFAEQSGKSVEISRKSADGFSRIAQRKKKNKIILKQKKMYKTKLNRDEIRHVIAQNANRIQQLEKEMDYLQLINQMLDTSLSNSQISENYAVE